MYSPAVLKLEEGARDGKLAQFYLSLADKDDKFLVVFAFIKLGLLEVRESGGFFSSFSWRFTSRGRRRRRRRCRRCCCGGVDSPVVVGVVVVVLTRTNNFCVCHALFPAVV